PDMLVEQAVARGLPAMVLIDRNGIYGVVRAHVAAKKHGNLKLLLGAELSIGELTEDMFLSLTRTGKRKPPAIETPTSIALLAEDRDGWARLCRLISIAHGRGPKGSALLSPRS